MATRGKRARTGSPQDMSASKVAKTESEIGTFTTDASFIKTLLTTRVEQLPIKDNKIFICQRTDKVIDVWKGLIKHNFLSVPVLQKTGSKYYGFVDLADIVRFISESFGETKLKEFSENFWQLVEKEEYFQSRTINDIMIYPLSKRNPFHPVTKGYSLFSAIELLARETGLHRVPVVDENRRLVHLVTQSQVIEYLNNNIDNLGTIVNMPASQLKNLKQDVITVRDDTIALDAFITMTNKHVSGLAVVDDSGKLVGNISLRDLKAISNDARLFWRLYQTMHNFLQKIKEENPSRPRGVVCVNMETTLKEVITKLAENKVHRIYVVDADKKPVGVASLKDILLEIISNVA